jgi:hypothetical protein
MKESAVNSKGEHMLEDADDDNPEMRGGLAVSGRRDSTMKREDSEANGNPMPPTITTSITTTKSGRASKPSTPALQSFPTEPIRSRSSRTALEQAITNKRSHKKGAGQAAQLIAAQQHNAAADDEASKAAQSDEDDLEIDADEPTYCYCNGVSYGEMVACDADGCAKEWFHLDCVGLKVAPKGNGESSLPFIVVFPYHSDLKQRKREDWLLTDIVVVTAKWYCDDCKENTKNSKRFNGR